MSSTVVSCPGKVLIAGGYLVLDPAYHGYVVATASRFYTVVVSSSSASNAALRICARSPQFEAAEWSYECRLTSDGADCQVAQTDRRVRWLLRHFVGLTAAQ
jgi:phosphomevalonate kinase